MTNGPVRATARLPLIATAILAIAVGGCGSTASAPSTTRVAAASKDPARVAAGGPHRSSDSGASARADGRIERVLATAKATYSNEVEGGTLLHQLDRIARDGVLLAALRRGDLASASAEARFQLNRPLNHLAHVTRIAVVRGSKEVVNATINANGVFVVAPGRRVLRAGGRTLGTLLVSIQDVIGFAKLVHNLTGAAVVVRGASGQLRTSPGAGAAANAQLPRSGRVTIAGRRYLVASFGEIGWGGEPLTVYILNRQ